MPLRREDINTRGQLQFNLAVRVTSSFRHKRSYFVLDIDTVLKIQLRLLISIVRDLKYITKLYLYETFFRDKSIYTIFMCLI